MNGGDRLRPVRTALNGERHLAEPDGAHRAVSDGTLLHVALLVVARWTAVSPGTALFVYYPTTWNAIRYSSVSSAMGPAWAARRRSASRSGSPARRTSASVMSAKRRQLHVVDEDLDPADPVATADLRVGPAPEPVGDGDVARRDVVVQFLAELHGGRLGRRSPGSDGQYCQTLTQSIFVVAGSCVVPGWNESEVSMPRAWVKARKNGWLKGAGAESGHIT